MPQRGVIPVAVRRQEGVIEITWDRTGHVGRFTARELRLACPCAVCVDEMSGRPLLDPTTVPLDVAARAIQPVGAYGLRIHWSDGHATGIFTYDALLARCPCPACRR